MKKFCLITVILVIIFAGFAGSQPVNAKTIPEYRVEEVKYSVVSEHLKLIPTGIVIFEGKLGESLIKAGFSEMLACNIQTLNHEGEKVISLGYVYIDKYWRDPKGPPIVDVIIKSEKFSTGLGFMNMFPLKVEISNYGSFYINWKFK